MPRLLLRAVRLPGKIRYDLVPGQPLLVTEDPHELRNGHGGVGVVQLDGNLRRSNKETGTKLF